MPLFKAQGYSNVIHYHGGPRELGKDIVMWKRTDFRRRENYAVVVKSGKITGSVSGKGSFSEIVTQVTQAFGSPYRDESTMEEVSIDHCLIAVNVPTPKEAIEAIYASLSALARNRVVSFLDFNSLVDYSIENGIGPDVGDSLLRLLEIKDPSRKIRSLSVVRDGEHRHISVEFDKTVPKADLEGNFTLNFPDTAEGRAYRDRYQDFVDSGVKVEIPKDYIASFSFPKAIQELKTSGELSSIVLGPVSSSRTVALDLTIMPADGHGTTLQGLGFKVKNQGKKSVEFIYDDLGEAFTLGLKIDLDGYLNLSYEIRKNVDNYSIVQVFRYYEFLEALAKGGKFEVIDGMSKLRIVSTTVSPGMSGEINSYLVELYRKAAFIQIKTNHRLTAPRAGFRQQDVLDIEEFYEILTKGKIDRVTGTVTFTVKDGKVPHGLDSSETKRSINLQFVQSHTYEILGEVLDIGNVEYFVREAIILHDLEKGRLKRIRVVITPEGPGTATYQKYN
jgi:hypothetical protein